MSLRENFVDTDSLEFVISPILLQISERDKRIASEQYFIDQLLAKHPSEAIEDVSAVSHETRRIPDPRILILDNGSILTLFRDPVDKYIEKASYIGSLEYQAFIKINEWSQVSTEGSEVWFGGKYPRKYPVDKIDVGTIRYSTDRKTKVLLKRAILLDIDPGVLLNLANQFADRIGLPRYKSDDELRSRPIFCTENELEDFFDVVSQHTDQVAQIRSGNDLSIKLETYQDMDDIQNEIPITNTVSHGYVYNYLRRRAEEERMIGDKSESCPTGSQTAFQAFSGSETIEASFPCPRCLKPIPSGRGITTCPHCGLTKEQAGSTCG